jgi:hypothetical protein
MAGNARFGIKNVMTQFGAEFLLLGYIFLEILRFSQQYTRCSGMLCHA